MSQWLEIMERHRRGIYVVLSLMFLVLIGLDDYVTGYELSFSVFYLLGVGVVTWFVGRYYAMVLAGLSVAVWMWGDMAMGANYSSEFVPVWNAAIMLSLYLIVISLLDMLHTFYKELELKVQERTAELRGEIGRRERLERELLEISECEKRQFGYELHEGLGQHLTGTAIAGQVLREKLAARGLAEAADAARVVTLAEEGVNLSRRLAKGLRPVEAEAAGLMQALEELAATSSELYQVSCRFESDLPVLVRDAVVAGHLYRIAQEAVGNAIRQGRAKSILIRFDAGEKDLILSIQDDGTGRPESAADDDGMYLQIMDYRASLMGAVLNLCQVETGGTRVACTVPAETQTR